MKTKPMSAKSIFKVIFYNQNEIYELYAKQVYQSELYGFIEVEEFLFGERAQIVVDPSEERLQNEFNDVARSYIPIQSIIRIDEVEKEGVVKISEVQGDKVTPLSVTPFRPRGGEKDKPKS